MKKHMKIRKRVEEFAYKHYWLCGMTILVLATIAAYYSDSENHRYYISFGVAVLSGVYFIQKQKLEEDKMFFEAFISFNQRFSDLTPSLLALASSTSNPSDEYGEYKGDITISKYFDLCAEEYYYYKHGRLPDDVWGSWATGILYYIDNYPCIKDYWIEMENSDSSYGLTISHLESVTRDINM